jgi:hypothetical protein
VASKSTSNDNFVDINANVRAELERCKELLENAQELIERELNARQRPKGSRE